MELGTLQSLVEQCLELFVGRLAVLGAGALGTGWDGAEDAEPRPGRTRATTSWAPSAPSSSNSMSSITVAYRHPTAHAITSHCARRCPFLWFLTLDKPETLSDNDVRPLTSTPHPRMGQKSR